MSYEATVKRAEIQISDPIATADQNYADAATAQVLRILTRAERVRALCGKYAWIP